MHNWLDQLLSAKQAGHCLTLSEAPLPGAGHVLSLAPHPDDPDAAGVALRALARGGWEVYWTILASGWSGVEDGYAGADCAVKARLREEEQRDSARFFGLPEERLHFLRLAETADIGKIIASEENRRAVFCHLDALAPDIVVLPHGDDTHPDHRLTYRWFADWAARQIRRVIALGNEDPKSQNLRPDFILTFGEDTAAWKADLLECHRSQSARNQATRGITFAARILDVNRHNGEYAERFQGNVLGNRLQP